MPEWSCLYHCSSVHVSEVTIGFAGARRKDRSGGDHAGTLSQDRAPYRLPEVLDDAGGRGDTVDQRVLYLHHPRNCLDQSHAGTVPEARLLPKQIRHEGKFRRSVRCTMKVTFKDVKVVLWSLSIVVGYNLIQVPSLSKFASDTERCSVRLNTRYPLVFSIKVYTMT